MGTKIHHTKKLNSSQYILGKCYELGIGTAKDRTKAGPTISPEGLILMTVGYKPYCQDYRSND